MATARYWRAQDLGEVDLLRAAASRHAYARHSHAGFAIGVVEAGAHGFAARGRRWVATPGAAVIVVNPEDPHDGGPVDRGGYSYRMLYVDPALLAGSIGDRRSALPYFPAAVVEDADLAGRILHLHRTLEVGRAGRLACDTLFLDALLRLARRHGKERPDPPPGPFRHRRIAATARAYLEAHAGDDVSLAELAAAAGASRFHLVRLFRREYGLPPHAWLMQHRLRRARRMLQEGDAPALVAATLGFVDQSHLTRRFAAAYGITPGRVRRSSNAVQAAGIPPA